MDCLGLWPSGTHATGRPSWPKWSLCPPVAEDEEGAEKKQPVRNWPRISLLPRPACAGASALKARMLAFEHQGCEDLKALQANREELEYLLEHVRNVMMREELFLPHSLSLQQQEPPTAASDKLHDDEDELRRGAALKYTQSQTDLAQLLQRLMLHTFFDASQAEAHRARLEQHLRQETNRLAVEHEIGIVQPLCVRRVRLPLSASEGAPELKLQRYNNNSGNSIPSIWSIRMTPGQVMMNVSHPICLLPCEAPVQCRAESSSWVLLICDLMCPYMCPYMRPYMCPYMCPYKATAETYFECRADYPKS